MNNTSTITTAVISCGYWGKNLVRNFANLGALGAVCDPNAETAQSFAEQYGIPAMSFEDVLASDEPAVVIATPAELHYKLARRALEAGKHVYVEKPLALVVGEAEELCKLADRVGKTLMVGHLLQYHPAFLKLKDMVLGGVLGELQYVYSNRLSLGKIRREENSLWSFAPHDISMILSLVGEEPDSVSATGAVVATDVPSYALMAGVPAKRIGWMSKAGAKLGDDLICSIEGSSYREVDGVLEVVERPSS